MEIGYSSGPDRDVVVAADVLGSFGVTPADVRAQRREYRTAIPPGQEERSLESVLEDVLADARDRTATVRRLICRSDRGLTCSARYAQRALGRELEAVFEGIGWSLEWTRTGPAANGRDRLELTATDPKGRRREATITYPETPLADDNLPAVLRAVDERLLAGTDATVVLLSGGVDRWRAALVETSELEALRDRYGPRVSAFDRPLLPEHGLEVYVPDEADEAVSGGSSWTGTETSDADTEPWPEWALERARRRSNRLGDDGDEAAAETAREQASIASFIDEAEPDRTTDGTSANASGTESASADSTVETTTSTETTDTTASPSTATGGFEIRGGAPSVSRVSDDGSSTDASPQDVADAILETQRERTATRDDRATTTERTEREHERETTDASEDGFGELSGSTTTTRVTNDSFGTDEAFETDDDRYRALGAALGAGGAVSVDGLLEDDEFLPELPAAEPEETRIEFEETFDPDATTATASAEQDGFEWVDSGSLETTRLSNR
ncbi:hypothetical protein RBH26_08015 [Natronolimnohabitans sp. A-GB9]|uniref:hypothetical protein n=1 Tax=Natronolimnohabitans sp. A-GB9 TaxID=3069757 RepID=UPI0027AF6002|nr:hypothetical protein [Natronolimnohabitans sp. A-GB9]MDQ2050431.1 hypothetical protein [Natronolimnohabitans sp. A-GB9]